MRHGFRVLSSCAVVLVFLRERYEKNVRLEKAASREVCPQTTIGVL